MHPPPHCILLDSQLPAVSGVQLIKFLRNSQVFRKTPVYIFSNEKDYHDIVNQAQVSTESFLTKPNSWNLFLALADLLMVSAGKKSNGDSTDVPEVPAADELRLLRR